MLIEEENGFHFIVVISLLLTPCCKQSMVQSFLKDLSIPTVKHQKLELVQLPFNQFKYGKDFGSSLNEFFLDESSFNDPSKLNLEELKTPIGNNLKNYQMIIPSGIKDPILLFKEEKSTFEKTLESNLDSLESLKYSIGLELVSKKIDLIDFY